MEVAGRVPALADTWSDRKRWIPIMAQKWERPKEHINLKEGRASLRGLRRAARNHRSHGCRVLSIGDNLVSICAFEKGRSKVWGLNAVARRAAAYQIGCRISWRQRHISSERCVADAGSRLQDAGFHGQCCGGTHAKDVPNKLPEQASRPTIRPPPGLELPSHLEDPGPPPGLEPLSTSKRSYRDVLLASCTQPRKQPGTIREVRFDLPEELPCHNEPRVALELSG